MAKRTGVLKLYGGIGLTRRQCEFCGEWGFVTKSGWSCCAGTPDKGDVEITRIKRECSGEAKRSNYLPPKILRDRILAEQGSRCAYCLLPFWHWVWDTKRRKPRLLRVEWDHVVPWEYSRSHKTDFVAACKICNGIKSDKVFNTMEEAMTEIMARFSQRYQYIGETCPIEKGYNPISEEDPQL